MIKKNSYLFGVVLGIIIPVIIFGIVFGINSITGVFSRGTVQLSIHKMMFASIALNILPMRYYLINKDLGNTGKGILIITLVLILIVTVVL